MLKYFLISLLLFHLTLSSPLQNSNNIPVIDVFVESLCPDCMDFIGGSFKHFQEAVDHEALAVINFYPFGNAKESWDGSNWKFECQHGPNECYGNKVEACALNHLSKNEGNIFLICLEGNIAEFSKSFDKTVEHCVFDENTRQIILACANGDEGSVLMHDVAQKTPKHNYVPWIHVNGKHDVNKENHILSNMLEFLRSQIHEVSFDDIGFVGEPFLHKEKSCYNYFYENYEQLNFLE